MNDQQYDVVIIGGGPAGLTAGLYTARARLKTLVLEKSALGGQIATTADVENYPGFPGHLTGPQLGELMAEQARKFGAEIVSDEVIHVQLKSKEKEIQTRERWLKAKAVILATGAQWQTLGVPGEAEFRGRGVSYCATCDADFFTDLEVAVVGGGNTAVEEAMYLTKFASKVTLIHRRDQLRADKIVQERAFANDKMTILWNKVVEEIKGSDLVEGVVLKDVKTGETSFLKADGVFVFIGTAPNSSLVRGVVELDQYGYIVTDEDMATSVPGVFAAGDVRKKSLRQVVTAAGDGATAAVAAEKYITANFAEV